MNFESWHAFYYGAWQWPWALLVVPFAWMIARAVGRGAPPTDLLGRFIRLWSTIFLVETMLDPIAGQLVKSASDPVQTGVGLFFVLAGDFRIYWLLVALVERGAWTWAGVARALGLTLIVPAAAFVLTRTLGAIHGEVPGQVLWLTHEALFVAVIVFAARFWVPSALEGEAARLARRICAWVAVYYSLWAAADVLILAGVDAGWLVRCIPNQLYYALTVPFVECAARCVSNARTSTSAQAAR